MPRNMNFTPPGPYVVYVVVDGVPSVGQFVNIFNVTESNTTEQVPPIELPLPQNKSPGSVFSYPNTTICLPNSTSVGLKTIHPTLDAPLLIRQYSNATTCPFTTLLPITTREVAHDRVLKPKPQTTYREALGGEGRGLLDTPSPAMPVVLKLPPMDPMSGMNFTSPSPSSQSSKAATPPAPPINRSLTTSTNHTYHAVETSSGGCEAGRRVRLRSSVFVGSDFPWMLLSSSIIRCISPFTSISLTPP